MQVLNILNFKDLFEVLLTQIKEKFKVPYVWISMIDTSEVSTLIQSLETSDMLKSRMNIIDRDAFLELVGMEMRPLLANRDLSAYNRLLPKSQPYYIKSIAIAPISLDGEVVGSLNQADCSPERFQPEIDTSRLEQLAVKVSLCMSNVMAHEKLRFLAYHDPLTGLLNRRVMESVLKREFNRIKRYASTLSAVFLDLDDFKGINDRYGHNWGDNVLKYVADKLLEMSRDSDIVARFAGDEFVYILPETRAKSAIKLMRRIESFFKTHPLNTEAVTIPVSISFGVASTEESGIKDPAQLLKQADQELYRAKQFKKGDLERIEKSENPF